MDKIKLYTNNGHFVEEVEVLPFKTYPEIIVWGVRYFARSNGQWREMIAYTVPITVVPGPGI